MREKEGSSVWTNVFDRGALKPGETLLLHGGASGIGTTAVMLAKAFGATLIATAGSDEKARQCERLGADLGINYRNDDFVARTLAATDGRGADVILDMVGGKYVGQLSGRGCRRADRADRIHSRPEDHDRPAADHAEAPDPHGLHASPAPASGKGGHRQRLVDQGVWPLIEAGRCSPVIDSVFALADAAKAHARLESEAHIGKIVLTT